MFSDIQNRGKRNYFFANWATTFSCQPELYFTPESVDEIKSILHLAHLNSQKIRIVGCGHSPSDIACCTGYMINLKKFNSILYIDEKRLQVRVQSGITLAEIIPELVNHDMALSVLGSVTSLTLAGAISTGTHGSGLRYGNLCSYVASLEIMKTTGEIIEVNRERDIDLFRAACCGLGAFGIILSITLQCEKAYNLEQYQYPCPLREVLENLEVHLKSSDHFRFLWFPHTDGTVVSHISRTSKRASRRTKLFEWFTWFWDYPIGYYLLEFSYWVSSFYPSIVPWINRCCYNLLFSKPKHIIDRSDKIFNFECLFKQYVNEWAVPIEKTAVVLYELQMWLARTPYFYAHFPVEVRFVKADDLFISPAYGHNMCYINVIMYRPYNKYISYEEYWDAYEKIMQENGGRPHWAKAHRVTAQEFRLMYPFFSKWCQLRKKMDPTDTLLNSYMERIL